MIEWCGITALIFCGIGLLQCSRGLRQHGEALREHARQVRRQTNALWQVALAHRGQTRERLARVREERGYSD
jgi:hypothetical protein